MSVESLEVAAAALVVICSNPGVLGLGVQRASGDSATICASSLLQSRLRGRDGMGWGRDMDRDRDRDGVR